jgi:hypothetical protein
MLLRVRIRAVPRGDLLEIENNEFMLYIQSYEECERVCRPNTWTMKQSVHPRGERLFLCLIPQCVGCSKFGRHSWAEFDSKGAMQMQDREVGKEDR